MKPHLVILILMFFAFSSSSNTVDSLMNLVRTCTSDTIRVKTLIEIADRLAGQDNTMARQTAGEALEISERIDYVFGISESYYYLGLTSFYTTNYPDALEYFSKSNVLKKQLGDIRTQANLLQLSALVYQNMADYVKAQENMFEALRIYESLNDSMNIGVCFDNIGITLFHQKEHEKSLEYFSKALEIQTARGDKYRIASALNNFYIVYSSGGESKKAKEFLLKAIEINREIGHKYSLSINLNNMGTLLRDEGNLPEALEYYNQSITLKKELGNSHGLAETYNGLGGLFKMRGDFQQALSWYIKAQELSANVGSNEKRKTAYKGMFECLKKLGQHSKANIVADSLFKIEEQLYDEQKSRQVASIEAQFQTEKKQREIERLTLEKTVREAELQRQRLMLLTTFLLVVLLVSLIGFVLLLYRNKRRANMSLLVKNQEIASQKEEILTQNELLNQQATMLLEMDQIKTKFFANISHELRTPLTLIVSPLTQMIENGNQENTTLQVMLRNAKRLQDMIDELLQLSRLEKGAMDIRLSHVDINQIVAGVMASLEPLATEKQIRIENQLLTTEAFCLADTAAIEKIASNLIANAIKFTPEGKSISIVSGIAENKFVFTVCDEGIGIPEEEYPKVFNRFYRGTNARNIPGTGIGLSLVRDLVSLHSGTIDVGSGNNQGVAFTVTIPLAENANESISESENESIVNCTQKFDKTNKILIVEDNDDLRHFLASALRSRYQTVTARDGQEGLEILEKEEIDAIISDVMMPRMDGFEFTRQVRMNPEICHLPVILLTARSGEKSVVKGLEVEADYYITKPFSLTHLELAIERQIKLRKTLQEKFRRMVLLPDTAKETLSADDRFLVQARQIVLQNIENSEFTPDEFATQLAISRASLHRKITALTGMSTTDFVRTIRLKKAAQLIERKFGTISEIAYATGFSDVSYFSKCFKKEFGVTPTEYEK
jgi:signal transduction histidine kinase/DNA-binding response OmpR family regulator